MRLPNMDRLRNQVVVVLVAVALAVPAMWWIFTKTPVNDAEANWTPPLLTVVTCTDKDTGKAKVFEEHPRDFDVWYDDTQRVFRWQIHHTGKCRYVHHG